MKLSGWPRGGCSIAARTLCRRPLCLPVLPYWSLLGPENCWDSERDARTYPGGRPVVAHPPCRAWGRLRHLAKPRHDERELAFHALDVVRSEGGVLEHPRASSFWKRGCPSLAGRSDGLVWGLYPRSPPVGMGASCPQADLALCHGCTCSRFAACSHGLGPCGTHGAAGTERTPLPSPSSLWKWRRQRTYPLFQYAIKETNRTPPPCAPILKPSSTKPLA